MKDSVLVVDDVDINREILKAILSDDYEVWEAANGLEAVDILLNAEEPPEAVLLDIMMPEMDGFAVLSKIKENPVTTQIPVLFITAADATINESRGLDAGAVDYIAKPFNMDVVKSRVKSHIQLQKYRNNLQHMLDLKIAEVVSLQEHMLETMASIIEYRSLESGMHIRRTKELTQVLIDELMKTDYARELEALGTQTLAAAVTLHDIGKIGIPDNILLKPGKLTDEEFDVIKTHCIIGSDIVRSMMITSDKASYLARAEEICRSHHERWDGRGYPDGLSGTNIPLAARILSVVDVYDALVTVRCYKQPMSHAKAVELIAEGRGTQFDPVVVDAFIAAHEKFHQLEEILKGD